MSAPAPNGLPPRRLTDPQQIAFIEAVRALPPDALPAVGDYLRDLAAGKDPWHAAYRFGIARGESPADACSAAERACAGSFPRPFRWPPSDNAKPIPPWQPKPKG